ncbi:MAG TPA: lysophospholipid acyltransferase family protein [Gammaproteobacteria bacterium]|nr:lysophospholipid acyltransferase family protein [Gammaproteobacteria bacterium]
MLRGLVLSVRSAIRSCYGCYAWLALLAAVVPSCVLLAITPGVEWRRRVARAGARFFFLAIGSPVRVEGESIGNHYPCVVVANHGSYLDGIILTAALPAGFTYLIKQEMARVPIAGFILRRLGSAFVNRDDALHRKRIARRLVEAAVRGEALGFFPEGTFDSRPGLKPFQPGAFAAAVRAKVPVVPVIIYGARHKLPANRVLPWPGPLRVKVCAPVSSGEHPTARGLLQATRAAMLAHLDEPDLAPAAPAEDTVGAGEEPATEQPREQNHIPA